MPPLQGLRKSRTLATSTSWVFDTGCVSHITSNVQGLRKSRTLAKGEVELRVGNGARVVAVVVGTYSLPLPSGLILELNNCYYVPAIIKNIISIPVLDNEGFSFTIEKGCFSVYLNSMFYATTKRSNGLYFLDCEPFDVCESCLMGKMTKSPFTVKGERASDLLGLIHTDVCGPMSTKARGGFGYFITLMDDLSRYGYVYLMKHKSASFEKFKEFQDEVQNQLGKTIKALPLVE